MEITLQIQSNEPPHLLLAMAAVLVFASLSSCSNMEGNQVKTPFSGKKYLSDARHFRAVGMGQSANLSIAKSKAELESKKALAQQVQTNLKVVSDNYAQELVGNQASEAIERFETLAREVTNTTIGDIRTLGEDIRQLDDKTYRVHVAIEVKKSHASLSEKQSPKRRQNLRARPLTNGDAARQGNRAPRQRGKVIASRSPTFSPARSARQTPFGIWPSWAR